MPSTCSGQCDAGERGSHRRVVGHPVLASRPGSAGPSGRSRHGVRPPLHSPRRHLQRRSIGHRVHRLQSVRNPKNWSSSLFQSAVDQFAPELAEVAVVVRADLVAQRIDRVQVVDPLLRPRRGHRRNRPRRSPVRRPAPGRRPRCRRSAGRCRSGSRTNRLSVGAAACRNSAILACRRRRRRRR